MNEPTVQLSLVSNVFIKQLDFKKKDDFVVSHQHSFDHQTLLARGRLRVFVDEDHVKEFTAPAIIVIRSGQNHVMHALEDNTVAYCVHAVRNGERVEDIVDPAHEVVADESAFVRKG